MIAYMNEIPATLAEVRPEIAFAIFISLSELQVAAAEEMCRYLSKIFHANLQPVMAEQLGVPAVDFIVSVITEGGSKYVADIQIIGDSLARLREQLSDLDQRPKLMAAMEEVGKTLRNRLKTVFSAMVDSNTAAQFVLGSKAMGEPAEFRIQQRFAVHFQVELSPAAQMAVRSAVARLGFQRLLEHRQERLDTLETRTNEELLKNKSALENVLKDKRGNGITVLNIAAQPNVDNEGTIMSIQIVVSGNPVGVDVLSDIANWVDQTLNVPESDVWLEPPSRLSRLSRAVRDVVSSPSDPKPVVFTVSLECPPIV